MGTENEEINMETVTEEHHNGTENPPEDYKIGDDDSKKDTNPPEGSSKPEVSEKNITPRSLKAKKIVKKSLAAKLKAKKNSSAPQILKKIIRKNQRVGDNAESSHNAGEKQVSVTQQNETKDEPPKEKSIAAENNEVKESLDNQKNKQIDELGMPEQKQRSKRKRFRGRRRNRGKRNGMDKNESKDKDELEDKEKSISKDKEKSVTKDKEKSMSKDKEKSVAKDKIERVGGLIFMCNAKTKPDCFRYSVMGVSSAKKEDVLRIKPGLKLFLYDFDLKLLYGIYKASSSGGMKLEPKAFNGKFPAQVRFKIVSDSFPLPESVFRKAIKDNYDEKNKFKTELTVGQVRKLTRLFRPVGARSAAQPIYSSPKAIIREREALDKVRGLYPHSRRERGAEHRSARREEAPRDSFLIENYRAHALQGDRSNMAMSSRVNPVLEPYERDYEHRIVDHRYRSNVLAPVESLRRDPLYLNGREHQHYTPHVVFDHIEDPYASRRVVSDHIEDPYASSRVVSDHIGDPYSYRYGASLGRDGITSGSYLVGGRPYASADNLPRREMVHDRRYPMYSVANSLSDYDRMQPYPGDKLEASPARVTSRYSFDGPSFSRR